MVKILIDAFGGDNCPDCNIEGAIDALSRSSDIEIGLLGDENTINSILAEKKFSDKRLSVINATEVITLDESPVMAVKRKKDSGIVKGIGLVKEKQADAFISAGSSGAVLAGGTLLLGRIKGVKRPPLGSLIPTQKGVSFFLDMGANVDADPLWLHQFAKMGSIYMNKVMGIEKPTVKLVNLGLEEEKGNKLVKEVNALLKQDSSLNYQGYCEAREVPYGTADVIVTDAFTGNAMLKMFEGTAGLLLGTVKSVFKKNLLTKAGAALMLKTFKDAMRPYDVTKYGGAPLLGVNGIVIKCHGNATRKEIANAVLQAETFAKSHVNDIIANAFEMN